MSCRRYKTYSSSYLFNLQSDTSSRKDDKSDSIADNEEDPDLMQFNQLIDADIELPTHYSSPRVPTPPPPATSSLPPSSTKRQSKNMYSNSNCKRTKSDVSGHNHNTKTIKSEFESINNAKPPIVDETEFPENFPASKQQENKHLSELEDNKDNLKHILENSLGTAASADGVAADHGEWPLLIISKINI